MTAGTTTPDVFSAREIARAAGVSVREARALMDTDSVRPCGVFMTSRDAVRAVRLLRGATAPTDLFRPPAAALRSPGRALAASGALHAAVLGGLVLTTMGLASAAPEPLPDPTPVRLVFLATPGPGGGGGGGGLRQPAPLPRAEVKAKRELKSPVPPPRQVTKKPDPEPRQVPPPPVRPQPVERPVELPPVPRVAVPLPQVVAPVVAAAADPRERAGVLTESASNRERSGPGTAGGAGTGNGLGIGEGSGSGIGPGSGGGTGGGPYRQGSGITAPSLLREVKPDYTEEARRRGVEGDVVLEIVVRADGSVTGVKVLQGLGSGLDQRAADAVRQWRFSPARRQGQAVDVIVEVAVEFTLR